MACFSTTHPFAYHAFPLAAARGLWEAGALHGKDDLGALGQSRRTGTAVDRLLGFSGFVHLYLPKKGVGFTELPILCAQLKAARQPASPHAVLVVPTAGLADRDCTICNWNIAVSRPSVAGRCKGGNWTRGTDPQKIAAVWDAFRATSPTIEQARGFWGEPRVPIVPGERLEKYPHLLRSAPRNMPELLLRSPARLFKGATILTFSGHDLASLQRLGAPPDGARLTQVMFPEYGRDGDPIAAQRAALDEYLAGARPAPPPLDFDAIRS